MILRELFEARAKAKSVGIIFGRFNPPHMGHMKAWEMASENSVWYVGTNKSTQGPKDPLPFDIKVKAMQAVYPEIKGHIVAEISWLTLASKVYEKHGNIVLNVYTDEDWVTKTLIQYNGKEGTHGYYEFGTIQQQTTPRLSSATALRNAVAADDRDLFGQAAGVDPNTLVAGHPFFDVVKHYLMPHAEKAAAKVAKKKVKEPATDESLLGFLAKKPQAVVPKKLDYDAVRKASQAGPQSKTYRHPEEFWKDQQKVKKPEKDIAEGTSIESTLRAVINDIGEPITNVYDTMKFQAKKYMENHGELDRGFRMVAAGIGGRWVQSMYVGRLQNELYDLCKYNTRRTVELKQFLRGVEADGELEMKRSFGNIANELPRILAKLGQHLNAPQLTKNANRWMQNKAAYEEYIANLELEDDYDEPAVAKSPKNPAIGQQRSQVEDIVNDVLSKLPKKIAGDIRNAIARSPNKLQALQAELKKHEQKSVAEGWKGALAGAAVGNAVGGPIGAGIGAGLGHWIGNNWDTTSSPEYIARQKKLINTLPDDIKLSQILKRENIEDSSDLETIKEYLKQNLDDNGLVDIDQFAYEAASEIPFLDRMGETSDLEGIYMKVAQRVNAYIKNNKKKGVTENAWDRLQREKALESAGVGIITKQNSTVDVNKNTPKKNLKAFRLA